MGKGSEGAGTTGGCGRRRACAVAATGALAILALALGVAYGPELWGSSPTGMPSEPGRTPRGRSRPWPWGRSSSPRS